MGLVRVVAMFLAVGFIDSVARADTVLVDERLDDMHCDFNQCTVSEGAFDTGGWRVISADSRLTFDLSAIAPAGIACGEVSLEFYDFDPINTGHTGEYVNFLGLYEDSHGNNWSAAGADEAQLQFQGTCDQCVGVAEDWRDYRVKFKAGACDWDIEDCGGENAYLPANNVTDIDWSTTLDVHYTATAAWSCSALAYSLTDGTDTWTHDGDWGWHPKHLDPKPHFRYVFVGRDHSPGAGRYIDGAVYVHLLVVEHDDCDCAEGDDDDAADDDTADDDASDDDTADDDTADDDASDDDSAGGDGFTDDAGAGEGCGCRQGGTVSAASCWALLLVSLWVYRRR